MTHLQHNYNKYIEISVHNQIHFFSHVNSNTGTGAMKSSPTNACSCIDQRARGWKKIKEKILILYKNYWEKPNKREIPNEAHNFKGDSKLASDVQSWSLRKAKWKGNLMSFNCCKTFNKHFPKRILHVTRWQILPHSLPHHLQQKIF